MVPTSFFSIMPCGTITFYQDIKGTARVDLFTFSKKHVTKTILLFHGNTVLD